MNRLVETVEILALLVLLALGGGSVARAGALQQGPSNASREAIDFFEKKVRPVLVERCIKCHSTRAGMVKGRLSLDSRDSVLRGGESGEAIVPGDPVRSLLIKAIRYTHDELGMPPKRTEKLSPEQVADFEAWVRMEVTRTRGDANATALVQHGIDFAKARGFWSFKPLAKPRPPEVKSGERARNEIDLFILAGLDGKRLRPVPEADKMTLLRRATFDLTGLPPAPEEIESFLEDTSPLAFERMIDRLLESPHYGERWGRHWLDVVRYADTAGDSADYPVPQAYRYRNYVIQAFNEDKPYDQFLREQVAGDLLPSRSDAERYKRIIATGFLAVARRFGTSPEKFLHLTIDDTIETLGRSVLGLGLGCARCHDHKFDPVSAEDYYALYGIFESTRYPWGGADNSPRRRDLVPLASREEVDAILRSFKEREAALKTEVARVQAGKEGGALAEAKRRLDEHLKDLPPIEVAYAMREGSPHNAKVLVRGNPASPGRQVDRRFLAVLGGQALPEGSKGSGRLDLAGWLTDLANPLTARVLVNRLWQHHLGKGIVQTPNDFGAQGKAPTHPELLDYLAARFVEEGWSIKSMHRLIMQSAAYRRSSDECSEGVELDPNNEFLWRFNRRRLDAEAIRDAMLAVSGELDRTMAGAHPIPPQNTWAYLQDRPFTAVYETRRRSVYLLQSRVKKNPFLEVFDGADPNASVGARFVSVTAIQALFAMNSPVVHDQAEKFAERMIAAQPEQGSRIEWAYLWAFGRPPSEDERRLAAAHVRTVLERLGALSLPEDRRVVLAWASLGRALFCANEFVFVD